MLTAAARRRLQAQQGISMVEIMLSILVLAIAMLGMFKAASVAVYSNQRGHRIEQATTRAQTRLEALRNVPTATLDCLAAGSAPSACLGGCIAAGGETDACNIALAMDADSGRDSTGTLYSYGFLVSQPQPNVYDILVVASFQDDSADPPRVVRSLFRTAVFRQGATP
jgi:Tfp pilus assembly protein PilX